MTQEDKELLLKDLCARLPYNVKVKFKVNDVIACQEKLIYNVDGEYSYITDGKSYLTLDIIKMLSNNYLDEIKPYLFPLSSITIEQEKELSKLGVSYGEYALHDDIRGLGIMVDEAYIFFEFCYKHHIDFLGLIEKGLANDATDKNVY